MNKKILITGAFGFIAMQIAEYFCTKYSYKIYGTSRVEMQNKNFIKLFKSVLGEELPEDVLNIHYDLIIHAANSTSKKSFIENTEGTKAWFKQLAIYSDKQILLSSISAISDNDSSYAQAKKNLEHFFEQNNMPIVRLGLVIGDGGLFKKICNTIKKFPLIPLINNGSLMTYTTSFTTILDFIYRFVNKQIQIQQFYNLQNPHGISYKNLLILIKQTQKSSAIFIPIPFFLIYYLIIFLESLNIWPFAISGSNLKGLVRNSNAKLNSDIKKLNLKNTLIAIEIQRVITHSKNTFVQDL